MNQKTSLYQNILDHFKSKILAGDLKPGESLPPIRELVKVWNCTPGTIQRAFATLVQEGLIHTRPGLGTHVADRIDIEGSGYLQKQLMLVNRSEAFILEMLSAGFKLDEIQKANSLAFDRWRVLSAHISSSAQKTIRFYGSHDMAVSWIQTNIASLLPEHAMTMTITGSLGGLIALAEGNADLAGCHLWDHETDLYNLPFIQKVLPGRQVLIMHMAKRRTGLVLQRGNPKNIRGLQDLVKDDVLFVNRQEGSGIRVWLDAQLEIQHIDASIITGYSDIESTHTEVARRIAEGKKDVGIALEASAKAFNLDFIALNWEQYDLVMLDSSPLKPAFQSVIREIKTHLPGSPLLNLPGYDFSNFGETILQH